MLTLLLRRTMSRVVVGAGGDHAALLPLRLSGRQFVELSIRETNFSALRSHGIDVSEKTTTTLRPVVYYKRRARRTVLCNSILQWPFALACGRVHCARLSVCVCVRATSACVYLCARMCTLVGECLRAWVPACMLTCMCVCTYAYTCA